MMRSTILLAVTLALVIAGPSPVQAQSEGGNKTTTMQVLSIRATTQNKDVSPELKTIADQLKKQFKYTGFKLESKTSKSAATGATASATLTGDYHVQLTPKSNDGKHIQLRIQIFKGKDKKPKLDTTVTLKPKKSQLIGGPSLGNGDVLILAVSAR